MNAAKILFVLSILIQSFTLNARTFRCEGRIEPKPGQIQPITVQLIRAEDQVWFVEVYGKLIEVSRDLSLDPGFIKLNNFVGRGPNYVRADYDLNKKELHLAYHLGDQVFNGGLLSNCREIELTRDLSCDRALRVKWPWWEGL